MAVAAPPPKPKNAKSGDPTRVGSQDLIESRIKEACRALWWAEIIRTVLRLVVFSIAAVLIWAVIDQWIYSPGMVVRVIAFLGLAAAMATYFYRKVRPLVGGAISADYAARSLERDMPELRQSLTSYVTLSGEPDTGQLRGRVVRSIGSSTARHLKKHDALPHEATGTLRWWVATAVALVLLAGYAGFSPKNTLQSAARLLAPVASIEAPRRVSIRDVAPGNTEAIAGRSVEVSAEISGMKDDSEAVCYWELPSGRQEFKLEFDPIERRHVGQLKLPHSSSGNVPYRIVAGDASAGPFSLTVQDVPVVALDSVQYTPPKYTGQSPYTSSNGAITGVDGTMVRILASTNRAVAKAKIEFNPRRLGNRVQATAGVTALQIDDSGTSLSIEFPLRSARGRSAAVELESYRILVWDDADQGNPDPIVYPIRVVADLPPECAITVPASSPKDVPINAQQVIEVHASDPDYGLKSVALEIRAGIDVIDRPILWSSETSEKGHRVVEHRFRPSEHDLRIGDAVEVVAVATDNRSSEVIPNIEPNIVRTDPVVLKITASGLLPDENDPSADGLSKPEEQPKKDEGSSEKSGGESGEQQSGGGGSGAGSQQKEGGDQGEGGSSGSGEGEGSNENSGEGGSGDDNQSDDSDGEGNEGSSSSGAGSESDGESEGDPEGGDPSKQGGEGNQPDGDQPNSSDDGDSGNEGSNGGGDSSANESGGQSGNENAGQSTGGDEGNAPQNSGANNDAAGQSGNANDGGESGQQSGDNQQNGAGGDNGQNPQTGANDQGSGDESGGDQSSGGQESGGQESGGQQSGGQSGEGAGEQPKQAPQHDGEAFERIQEYMENQQQNSDSQGSRGQGESADQNRDGNRDQSGSSSEGERGGEQNSDSQSSSQNDGASGSNERNTSSSQDGSSGQSGDQDSAQGSEQSSSSGEDSASNDTGAAGSGDQDQSAGSESSSGSGADQNQDQGGSGDNRQSETGGDDSPRGEGTSGESGEGDQQQTGSEGSESESASNQQAGEGSNDSEQNQNDARPGSDSNSSETGSEAGKPSDPQPGQEGESNTTASTSAGGSAGDGSDAGSQSDEPPPPPDPANVEYAKKATDLVLDYLQQTRESPDPQLLEDLQWSKDDLQRFTDRWQKVRDLPNQEGLSGNAELEDALKSLGLRPESDASSSTREASDTLRNIRDSGNRKTPPAPFRDAFDAFRRAVGG